MVICFDVGFFVTNRIEFVDMADLWCGAIREDVVAG